VVAQLDAPSIPPFAQLAYAQGRNVDVVQTTDRGRLIAELLFCGRELPEGCAPAVAEVLKSCLDAGWSKGSLEAVAASYLALPACILRPWFDTVGVSIDDNDLAGLSADVAVAWIEFSLTTSMHGRPRTEGCPGFGPSQLRGHFNELASSMRRFSGQLIALDREAARQGQANTARGRAVRQLYRTIGEDFVRQLIRVSGARNDAMSGLRTLVPDQQIEGAKYLSHHAPLVNVFSRHAGALEELAAKVRSLDDIADTALVNTGPRDALLRRLASIWTIRTRRKATCSPALKNGFPSPFFYFVSNVLSYQMGRHRRLGISLHQNLRWAAHMEIYPTPSFKTVRKVIRSMENPPA